MRLTWRQRLDQQPSLWRLAHWPVIPIDVIPTQRRQGFLRNWQIVAGVLAGTPQQDVAAQHAVSPGAVSQLLTRCLGGDAQSEPALTQALIPHTTLKTAQRCRPLPTQDQPQGAQHAFQALLETVPGLAEGLDAFIESKLKDSPHAQSLTPQGFHGAFKRLLAEAHWSTDRYPYTSPSMAYESVRRYLHHRQQALQLARQGKKQRVIRPAVEVQHRRALRVIQIDEHRLDLENRAHLVLNDELIPLRLARASVLVAKDVDTSCNLGYHLAPTRDPNQQDMLTLIANCVEPWQPMTLTTPGLSYMHGACFPSGLPEGFPITFGMVQLDNALMHRAQSLVDLLCGQFGATLSYGFPAMPITRALVESVFDYIGQHGTHRVAATTGSHPRDPLKETKKNRKHPPTMSLRSLDEALSVLLTEYNVTPQANLGNASPLDLFRYHCQNHYVRYVPPDFASHYQPFTSEELRPVHWNKNENRAPFIIFYYVRYQGPGLIDALSKGNKIVVRYDRRDIRTLQAYTLDGKEVGQLQAPQSWMRYPHSLATRQLIHKHNKQYRFNMRDPLASYFCYVLSHRDQPKQALQMVRIYDEFTQGGATPLHLKLNEPGSLHESSDRGTGPETWQTQFANHRSK